MSKAIRQTRSWAVQDRPLDWNAAAGNACKHACRCLKQTSSASACQTHGKGHMLFSQIKRFAHLGRKYFMTPFIWHKFPSKIKYLNGYRNKTLTLPVPLNITKTQWTCFIATYFSLVSILFKLTYPWFTHSNERWTHYNFIDLFRLFSTILFCKLSF